MISTNLKRAALALIVSTAWGLPAQAQDIANDVAIQLEAQAGAAVAGQAATPPGLNVMQWSSNFQTPAPFWIGVEGQALDAAMRTALELPEKHGILIARVTEESPAAKAGLQAGDVLLQWCDAEQNCQPIESVEHLVKLVQDAAAKQPDKVVKLEYRRRGKTDTAELKPAKREGAQMLTLNMGNLAAHEHTRHQQSAMQEQLKRLQVEREAAKQKFEEAKKALGGRVGNEAQASLAKAEMQLKLLDIQTKQAEEQLKQFEVWAKAMQAHGFQLPGQGNGNFDVLIPAPGIVTRNLGTPQAVAQLPSHAQLKAPEWPENLSVTMKRTGNKPAEFIVERGENKWQVTAETLKDLPPDVRALVEPLAEPQRSRMMRLWSASGDEAPGRVELRVPEGERAPVPGLPIAPPRVVIHATPQLQQAPATQATQKQIEELQKALEQLRKQVELMEKK